MSELRTVAKLIGWWLVIGLLSGILLQVIMLAIQSINGAAR